METHITEIPPVNDQLIPIYRITADGFRGQDRNVDRMWQNPNRIPASQSP